MVSLNCQFFKDFRMTKNKTKNYYHDEDLLFLMLKLVDYPLGTKNTFNFDELKSFNFKKPIERIAFEQLIETENANGSITNNFQFDRHGFFFNGRKNLEDVFFTSISKNPDLDTNIALNNILRNTFGMDDLKLLYQDLQSTFFVLIEGINFKIKITDSVRKNLTNHLKKNVEYIGFEDHENVLRERIKETYREKGSNLVLKDSEFGINSRFIGYILAAEIKGDFEINSFASERDANNNCYFVASVDISNDFMKKIGVVTKEEISKELEYFIENKAAIFPASEKAVKPKIRIDSQRFRLAECLIKDYKLGVGRALKSAFEIVYKKGFNKKTGKDLNQLSATGKIEFLREIFKDIHRKGILENFKLKFDENSKTVKIIPAG